MPLNPFAQPPLLTGDNVDCKRQEIRDYFHAVCNRYESLFETLSCDEAYYRKAIPLRHPLIFYLGHTAAFFVNKFIPAGLIKHAINPAFESMFAIGVDEMSWDDLDEAHYDWPSVAVVKAYRREVRDTVDSVIASTPLSLPIAWEHPWWAILMGIEHELIHLETSSVLIRQLGLDFVRQHPAWSPCRGGGAAPHNDWVEIPAGAVQLGKGMDDSTYGWDNEYGRHSRQVPAFQAARYLVSNGEFRGFVDAGAYLNDAFWEKEGCDWKNYAGAQYPSFWVKNGESWYLRLMTEEVAMPWDWPVEVNFHEAQAFCKWRQHVSGAPVRLPTEDEWYRLYDLAEFNAGNANLHLAHYASSCPVNRFCHGELFDVIGNVWQWTQTPIYPFEGFSVHPLYDDFTAPTFDDRHNLFKGGSWISCGNETLKSARYAFRRHFFQHAGFRYVVAELPADAPSSHYETDKLLSEYAEFHYGDDYFGVANFPKALAELAIAAMADKPARNALDLGCASGRATFELARRFDHVTGIDFSARLIGLGVQLAEQGVLRYTMADEGELTEFRERRLADLGLSAVSGKVEFLQGDACNLKAHFCGYDLILAANLIDRLYSPRQFLASVHEKLNQGGLLIITSPYTWLEEHTRREEWLGGFKRNGESFRTLDGLKHVLAPHFRLVREPLQLPFVIRETHRKFQHSLSEITIWEKLG